MGFIEKFLERVAIFQKKYTAVLFILILLFTSFMILGFFKLKMESDLSKNNPQGLDIYQLNDKVIEKFGGQDTILILVSLDTNTTDKDTIKDIRDARIINYMMQLDAALSKESSINSVVSIADAYTGMKSVDDNTVRYSLSNYPELNDFFSKNYDHTFLIVRSDIGGGEKKIVEITDLIQEKIDNTPTPQGVEVMVTGNPSIRVMILDILKHDAIFTLLLAFIIIFILLIIMEQSVLKSILISMPLLLGLTWTIGTMGHLGIEISIVTAGLGAMLLGLGVEYGVFMLKRYEEEREKGKDQLESLKISLPSVGTSIMASGLTTVVGFVSLGLSFSPMLQKLGYSLALGIAFCLISALFVGPIIFITAETIEDKIDALIYNYIKKRYARHHDIKELERSKNK